MPNIEIIIPESSTTIDLSANATAIALQLHTQDRGKGSHIPNGGITDAEVASISQSKVTGLLDTLSQIGGVAPWEIISNAQPLVLGGYYAVSGNSLINLNLPSNPTLGSRLTLYSISTATFRLQQTQANDLIQIGDKLTTQGLSGRIESAGQGSCVSLVYLGDRWVGTILQGNFNIL